jgi:hypothetical protein
VRDARKEVNPAVLFCAETYALIKSLCMKLTAFWDIATSSLTEADRLMVEGVSTYATVVSHETA